MNMESLPLGFDYSIGIVPESWGSDPTIECLGREGWTVEITDPSPYTLYRRVSSNTEGEDLVLIDRNLLKCLCMACSALCRNPNEERVEYAKGILEKVESAFQARVKESR